jgi:hypothetical protein
MYVCVYVCEHTGLISEGRERCPSAHRDWRGFFLRIYIYIYIYKHTPIPGLSGTSVNTLVIARSFFPPRNRVPKRWGKKGSDEPMRVWKAKKRLRAHSTDVNNSRNGSMILYIYIYIHTHTNVYVHAYIIELFCSGLWNTSKLVKTRASLWKHEQACENTSKLVKTRASLWKHEQAVKTRASLWKHEQACENTSKLVGTWHGDSNEHATLIKHTIYSLSHMYVAHKVSPLKAGEGSWDRRALHRRAIWAWHSLKFQLLNVCSRYVCVCMYAHSFMWSKNGFVDEDFGPGIRWNFSSWCMQPLCVCMYVCA